MAENSHWHHHREGGREPEEIMEQAQASRVIIEERKEVESAVGKAIEDWARGIKSAEVLTDGQIKDLAARLNLRSFTLEKKNIFFELSFFFFDKIEKAIKRKLTKGEEELLIEVIDESAYRVNIND